MGIFFFFFFLRMITEECECCVRSLYLNDFAAMELRPVWKCEREGGFKAVLVMGPIILLMGDVTAIVQDAGKGGGSSCDG